MTVQISHPEQHQDSNEYDICNAGFNCSTKSVTAWRKKFSRGRNDTERYWHKQSEPYTGCDALLTAFENGWEIIGEIYSEQYDLPSD